MNGLRCYLIAALAIFCWSVSAAALETLRVLAWEGYADADVVAAFEQKHQVRVEVTLVDSDTVMWQKLGANGGTDFDVFAANTAELVRYRNAGLIQPIDATRIPNVARQLPQFREPARLPEVFHQGRRIAVPYAYAEMGLIYDPKVFPKPPTSIAALWDPAQRGRVLLYDGGNHNFSLTALKLGATNPFRISPEAWREHVQALIALRRNALGFYSQVEESLKRYREGKATLMLANYGSQQVHLFRKAGLEIGYTVPREGALAWLDCWAITAATPRRELAERWIDHLLEPASGKVLVERHGLSNTLLAGSAPEGALRLWLRPSENVERREQLWGRIIAGDRLDKVLAP